MFYFTLDGHVERPDVSPPPENLQPPVPMRFDARPRIPTTITAELQQWLVLTTTPTVPYTPPANLRSRAHNSSAVVTNAGTEWLVLTAKAVLPPTSAAPSTSEQSKATPSGEALAMLEDRILEPFVPHRQRSFSSLLATVVDGDKGEYQSLGTLHLRAAKTIAVRRGNRNAGR
ncbi:uncharacterized protein LAJ45_01106 [Morchella importuna]|uniref:uncharacterized protein n=1 Tax=Morchella importuna TaxID=1174673 RepID=UPI001E8DA69F|nr:uncharacterized protein LAJ45_01106 [Morchella importuna]KAH8154578.1 hypothetical protein LAJ45_01106 [Morchella importuna]